MLLGEQRGIEGDFIELAKAAEQLHHVLRFPRAVHAFSLGRLRSNDRIAACFVLIYCFVIDAKIPKSAWHDPQCKQDHIIFHPAWIETQSSRERSACLTAFKPPVLYRLGNMCTGNGVNVRQIRNRARHLEYAVIRARG